MYVILYTHADFRYDTYYFLMSFLVFDSIMPLRRTCWERPRVYWHQKSFYEFQCLRLLTIYNFEYNETLYKVIVNNLFFLSPMSRGAPEMSSHYISLCHNDTTQGMYDKNVKVHTRSISAGPTNSQVGEFGFRSPAARKHVFMMTVAYASATECVKNIFLFIFYSA